jgi:hypothetical protein
MWIMIQMTSAPPKILRWDDKTSRLPSPSPTVEGLVHPIGQPPQMIRSTQIDPNEIQFEDFLREAKMEVQSAWEGLLWHNKMR